VSDVIAEDDGWNVQWYRDASPTEWMERIGDIWRAVKNDPEQFYRRFHYVMPSIFDEVCKLDDDRKRADNEKFQAFADRDRYRQESDYYREELAKAHALLGRVVHQASERWDTVRVTSYFPTDNLHGQRTLENPTGKAKRNA